MKLTNNLDANSLKVQNLSDPASAQDAATKAYVDASIQGWKWKEPVRLATTANITLSGLQVVDGSMTVANDRVMVKNNSTGAQNGIYLASSGSWTRAPDFDVSSEVLGATVFVSEGATQGNTTWTMTTDGPITLGTTALTFTQTSGGSSYTAGTGINIGGGVISIDTAVTARRATAAIGDGSSTTLTFTHNLNTRDVVVSVYDAATYTGVICDWTANGVNTVQLTFAIAPTSGQYRVTVVG